MLEIFCVLVKNVKSRKRIEKLNPLKNLPTRVDIHTRTFEPALIRMSIFWARGASANDQKCHHVLRIFQFK